MFFEFTHKVDGKAVLVNMALVRYIYPMTDGCDLIFDPHHSASVSESPAKIKQLLAAALNGKKKRAHKAQRPTVDAALQGIEDAERKARQP